MSGKNLVIAMLFSAVLLALAFSPMTGSQTTHEYDPWADMNDDGMIRIDDVYYVASKFGTTGTPINKTQLLLGLNTTVSELQSKVASLNASLIDLQSVVAYLETKFPKVTTFINETSYKLKNDDWYDLISVFNVTVPQGADVVMIATATFYVYGSTGDTGQLWLRMRVENNKSSPIFKQDWVGESEPCQIVGIHHCWCNLTAGNYTLSVQYYFRPGDLHPISLKIINIRLTLIII